MLARKLGFLIPLMCLGLIGCEKSGVYHQASDYVLDLNYKEDFKILQLTDIHIGAKDDQDKHFKLMDLTIKDANPDLIVVSGDVFTFADKVTAQRLFTWLDRYETPWTMTWGNHDEQCYFSIDWLTGQLNNLNALRETKGESYCVFKDIQDDDVFGNANFVINLKQGTNVFQQIYIMDSNRYDYSGFKGYDYFKDSQIKWYQRMVEFSKNEYRAGAGAVKSIMFFHIPLCEYKDAWDLYSHGGGAIGIGENGEGISCSRTNSGMFSVIKEGGSTYCIYVGHDHINNSQIIYNDVLLGYGINSTDRIYSNRDWIGGRTLVVHSTIQPTSYDADKNSITYEYVTSGKIVHSYSEVE